MQTTQTKELTNTVNQPFFEIEKLVRNHNNANTEEVKSIFASLIERKVVRLTRH